MSCGKYKFTILIEASRQFDRQFDIYADDFTIENEGGAGNEPYVRFWNNLPAEPDSDDCESVAVFVLANIIGFIDLGTQ